MSEGRVLVVDDQQSMCEMLDRGLSKRGYQVVWGTNGEQALAALEQGEFDAVLADIHLAGESGLDLCQRIVALWPDLPVVVITAFGSMDTAIAAMRVGAYDFVNKPVELEPLALTLGRAVQNGRLRREVAQLRDTVRRTQRLDTMVGESPAMRRVYDRVDRVADSEASILITGESGTGKELVARALHNRSARAEGPFVAVNCAAVPANLLESELFGHVRGAFTDASTTRKGLLVEADGGTLLLDEIGEMALPMQSKLLRALQERTVRPVGASTETSFDTRVVAATNRDLDADVDAGRFREDLFYRINVVRIHVPPLRHRGNDILLLAQHFLQQLAARSHKQVTGFTPEAARKLLDYEWPGNVRELENCVERAITLTRFEQIRVSDLPDRIRAFRPSELVVGGNPEQLPTLEELERRYIERVLRATAGNKTQAAKVLGLDRRTLYRKLDRYEK